MVDPVLIVTTITAIISGITAILQWFQSAKMHNFNSNCCAVQNTNTTTNNYDGSEDV